MPDSQSCSTNNMVTQAADVVQLLQELPVWQLIPLVSVVVVASLVVARLVMNSLPGKTPPIFEGIPFIGGLIKFTKVRIMAGSV